MFELSAAKWTVLGSQLATATPLRSGRRYAAYAFTEQDAATPSSVLKSARAVAVKTFYSALPLPSPRSGLPNRSSRSQELALISDVTVEKSDMEVVAQADEVPIGIGLCDLAAEDTAIEFTDAIPILPRNQHRRVVAKNDVCHGFSFPERTLVIESQRRP
jgi:hypothetical protein